MTRTARINVALVGAGPGDPELITLKAFRLIQEADILLYDSLANARIVNMARRGCRRVDVGKRCGRHGASQEQICALLVAAAKTGARVVRLKGGDPMIFGRATEEMAALDEAGIAYEIVPGVTAATAAAACLRKSLTKRATARSLHFLTGHGAEGGLPAHDWVSLTKSGGTLVVYMGSNTAAGLASHLIEAGMDPTMPAIAMENASLLTQREITGTIATLPRRLASTPITGPVLLLIGEALSDSDIETAARRLEAAEQAL
jgi:uroporphyrin-III C-methyltransferase